MKSLIKALCFSLYILPIYGQNLIPTDHWIIGSGSISPFSCIGSIIENQRVNGQTPYGTMGVVWQAIPQSDNGADGGWNTYHRTINSENDYRLSVWIKKSNSHSGSTYFGCNWMNTDATAEVLDANGNNRRNPYFWAGDLPALDHWYLLVGFIHKAGTEPGVIQSAIYDGETYQKVNTVSCEDFYFKTYTDRIQHRAYLYYDTNTGDRQYFYAPRIDLVNGAEPSINDLLRYDLTTATMLVTFGYDNSGNRTNRYLGSVIVGKSSQLFRVGEPNDTVYYEQAPVLETMLGQNFSVTIYPNPTKGQMQLKFTNVDDFSRSSYMVYDLNGKQLLKGNTLQSTQNINMEHLSAGNYVLKVNLKGVEYQWKIIKQ